MNVLYGEKELWEWHEEMKLSKKILIYLTTKQNEIHFRGQRTNSKIVLDIQNACSILVFLLLVLVCVCVCAHACVYMHTCMWVVLDICNTYVQDKAFLSPLCACVCVYTWCIFTCISMCVCAHVHTQVCTCIKKDLGCHYSGAVYLSFLLNMFLLGGDRVSHRFLGLADLIGLAGQWMPGNLKMTSTYMLTPSSLHGLEMQTQALILTWQVLYQWNCLSGPQVLNFYLT